MCAIGEVIHAPEIVMTDLRVDPIAEPGAPRTP